MDNYTFSVNGESYEPVEKDGKYYIQIDDIDPQELDEAVTVIVNETMEVTYSPLNYLSRMSEKETDTLQDLLQALYGYHLAAKAYIG